MNHSASGPLWGITNETCVRLSAFAGLRIARHYSRETGDQRFDTSGRSGDAERLLIRTGLNGQA
jgi:hypothetical protein